MDFVKEFSRSKLFDYTPEEIEREKNKPKQIHKKQHLIYKSQQLLDWNSKILNFAMCLGKNNCK